MNDAHDNAATDREMLARYATPDTGATDANGNPINVSLPIDLMPTVMDWHEAQQEASRITQAIMEGTELERNFFRRHIHRILTHYLVTGHLPDSQEGVVHE
jgi:hypothetical protein